MHIPNVAPLHYNAIFPFCFFCFLFLVSTIQMIIPFHCTSSFFLILHRDRSKRERERERGGERERAAVRNEALHPLDTTAATGHGGAFSDQGPPVLVRRLGSRGCEKGWAPSAGCVTSSLSSFQHLTRRGAHGRRGRPSPYRSRAQPTPWA